MAFAVSNDDVLVPDDAYVPHGSKISTKSFRSVHCTAQSTLAIWTFTFHKKSCVVDLEGKFQTNLQAKLINFLAWKFRSITLSLFFAEFVKSTAFYTLLLLFQRVDISKLHFDAKITIQICQLFGIAATVCKKQWI